MCNLGRIIVKDDDKIFDTHLGSTSLPGETISGLNPDSSGLNDRQEHHREERWIVR